MNNDRESYLKYIIHPTETSTPQTSNFESGYNDSLLMSYDWYRCSSMELFTVWSNDFMAIGEPGFTQN